MKKYCSKEKLKVLNEKEKQLRDGFFRLIIESKAKDVEVIRSLARCLMDFKQIKR